MDLRLSRWGGMNLKFLILSVGIALALGAAFAVRAARLRKRHFDARSDVTKLVSSAGKRRGERKNNAQLMRER